MYRHTLLTLAISLTVLPAARAEHRVVLDDFAYRSNSEIQAAWSAGAGVAPARIERRGSSTAGVFPLTFTKLKDRAVWDRTVALNLADRGWFEIDVEVDDPAVISHLTFYFQSPPGWYASVVPLEAGRHRVRIDRSTIRPDGWGKVPGPWSRITSLRISPWKAQSRDAVLKIHSVEAVRPDVVLVRADSVLAARHREAASIRRISHTTLQAFRKAGIQTCFIPDTDIADGALNGVRLAVFPFNYRLPAAASKPLRRFAAAGGKLIAFYSVPAPIPELLGIRSVRWHQARTGELERIAFTPKALTGLPASITQRSWNCHVYEPARADAAVIGTWRTRDGKDTGTNAVIKSATGIHVGHILTVSDPVERTAFVLALVGAYVPQIWKTAGEAALKDALTIEGVDGAEGLRRLLAERRAGPQARARFEHGTELLTKARAAVGKPEAPALAAQAHDAFIEALARSFRPRAGEIRAAWCHSAYGVKDLGWDNSLRSLATAGFTAVIPNMLWAGVADYPSAILPVRGRVKEKGDQIAKCLQAAEKYGLEVHVWKVNWNLSGAPAAFVSKLKAAGRLQVDTAGQTVRWLCPSHQENFVLERDSMLEVVRKYRVTGIHFDYIRYPNGRSCFCPTCRAAFEKRLGRKVVRWPRDVTEGPMKPAYRQYRRDTITRLVRAVAAEARKSRPDVKISAAVFPDWESARDERGQDWRLWVREGLLDFVCPMDYTPSRSVFAEQVRRQRAWAGETVPVVPGLGLSVHTEDLTPDDLLWMIDDARRAGAGGFTLFQLDQHVLWRHLPFLRMGTTAR